GVDARQSLDVVEAQLLRRTLDEHLLLPFRRRIGIEPLRLFFFQLPVSFHFVGEGTDRFARELVAIGLLVRRGGAWLGESANIVVDSLKLKFAAHGVSSCLWANCSSRSRTRSSTSTASRMRKVLLKRIRAARNRMCASGASSISTTASAACVS